MNWAQLGAVGGLVVVALGLIEVIKLVIARRRNGSDQYMSKVDCANKQNEVKQEIQNELKEFRKDLQAALGSFDKKLFRHEDRFHLNEISGMHRNLNSPAE